MNSKRFLLPALFLFFFSVAANAQNTILWKIGKPGNTHVSYLLGTFHILGESFVDSFRVITEKLFAADLLVSEAVVDRQRVFDKYAARAASDSLSKSVSADDVALIKQIFAKSSFDVFKFTPAELLMNLGIYYYQWGCWPRSITDKYTCDEYLQRLAGERGIAAFYFEADSTQEALVRQQSSYITWAYFHKTAPAVLKLYRRSSAAAGYCRPVWDYLAFRIDYDFKGKCVDAALVEDRNRRWMADLPRLLDTHNCFIDVGVQHLCNRCGLIVLLRAAGYTVDPVDIP
jgi:uncharacterized protein YbaP (TraB family)